MILEVSRDIFGHFLLGSHNFIVTALGLCVKWLAALPRNSHGIHVNTKLGLNHPLGASTFI